MSNPLIAPSTHTFTAWVLWGEGYGEEVDVVATSHADARARVEAVLTEDYKPGWNITRIEQRPNGFLFL